MPRRSGSRRRGRPGLRLAVPALLLVVVALPPVYASKPRGCPAGDRLPRRWACLRGLLRLYDFGRLYEGASAPPDQHALAIGGMIGLRTRPFFSRSLRAGLSFWDAQGIPGLENHEARNARFDPTLYGLEPVRALVDAYLSWREGPWRLAAGDRVLRTPWMGASDSRMVPASYQGGEIAFVSGGWRLELLRVTRWKSRTSSAYSATTLYNTPGTGGIEGGSPVAAVGSRTTPGTLALGVRGPARPLRLGLWYYDFDEYARLVYGTLAGRLATGSGRRPAWKIQALREWSHGPGLLGQPVDTWAWGGEILLPTGLPRLGLVLAFDRIVPRANAFDAGGIVSPYSAGYATDPLYTTSMIAGLVEKGPGSSVRLALTDRPEGSRTRIVLGWARYFTSPRTPDTSETDIDLTWWPPGTGGRLSLRNRLGVLTGLSPPSPLGTFVYERFMTEFRF